MDTWVVVALIIAVFFSGLWKGMLIGFFLGARARNLPLDTAEEIK